MLTSDATPPITGTDVMGNHTSTSMTWQLKGTSTTYKTTFKVMICRPCASRPRRTIQVYPSAVIFRQDFPQGLQNSSAKGSNFVAEFPALDWASTNPATGFVTWNGGVSGDI